MIDFEETMIKIKKNQIRCQHTFNGFLLYDITTDVVYRGNEIGLEIINLLDGTLADFDVAKIIAERYSQDLTNVLVDLREFFEILHQNGLLELTR